MEKGSVSTETSRNSSACSREPVAQLVEHPLLTLRCAARIPEVSLQGCRFFVSPTRFSHCWHMDALREWMESDLDVIMVAGVDGV